MSQSLRRPESGFGHVVLSASCVIAAGMGFATATEAQQATELPAIEVTTTTSSPVSKPRKAKQSPSQSPAQPATSESTGQAIPPGTTLQCNRLSLCIQPDEGIHLNFQTKVPDKRALSPADLEFHYHDTFPNVPIPDGYERLLEDAIQGDATLFIRADEVEYAWRLISPLLEAWEAGPAPAFPNYEAGTWGPPEADQLFDGSFGTATPIRAATVRERTAAKWRRL